MTLCHRTPRTVLLAATAALVLTAGIPSGAHAAAPHDADSPRLARSADGTVRYVDPSAAGPTRSVTGVLIAEPGHDSGGLDWSITRPDGTNVPVHLGRELPSSLTTGDITAQVTEAGELVSAAVQPTAQAAPVTSAQTVYLAKVTNRGGYGGATDTDIKAVVQRGLDRWVAESNGYIPSFTIVQMKDVTATDTTPGDGVDCESGSKVWRQFEDDFDMTGGFSGQDGRHLLAVQPQGCGGGVGSIGTGINSSGGMTFDYYPAKNRTTIVHELGHNFGLNHATAYTCSSNAPCANADYGNSYNAMGSSIISNPPVDPGAFDSFDRDRLGILSTGELQQLALPAGTPTTTGVFDLHGRATNIGSRGVKVIDPVSGQPWYLDFRNGIGRDASTSYAGNRARTTGFRIGVTVQRTINSGNQSELQTTSLTQGNSNYALRAGESWTTPDGGVTVAVTSVDTTASEAAVARFSVTLTNPAFPAQTTPTTPTPTPTTGAAVPGSGVAVRFTKTATPKIKGAPRVGQKVHLGLRKPVWQPSFTTVTYRWHVGRKVVENATKRSLHLAATYRGKKVWATVSLTRPGYESVTFTTRKVMVKTRR